MEKTNFDPKGISEEEYSEKIKNEGIEPFPIKMINPEIISFDKNLKGKRRRLLIYTWIQRKC